MPTDEERAAFKRSELDAARAIMAGDRYCPDPSVHGRATPRADAPPPLPSVDDLAEALNDCPPFDPYASNWHRVVAEHVAARLRTEQEGEDRA